MNYYKFVEFLEKENIDIQKLIYLLQFFELNENGEWELTK